MFLKQNKLLATNMYFQCTPLHVRVISAQTSHSIKNNAKEQVKTKQNCTFNAFHHRSEFVLQKKLCPQIIRIKLTPSFSYKLPWHQP